MHSFIVRVWMPDRPGALGAVASRIGAAGGDVAGIEIIEQGAGRAIDELVVHLPDPGLVQLLIDEVSEVDGVDVEEVRPTSAVVHDPRAQALTMAADLVEAADAEELAAVLCREAGEVAEAAWTAVVDLVGGAVLGSGGEHPPLPWLVAFVQGAGHNDVAADVIRAPIVAGEVELLLGRDGAEFLARQRDRVALLARIAAARWQEVRPERPSRTGRAASASPVPGSLHRP